MDYRAGLETDLSEVLQTDRIFTNVSKGRFAAANDLKKSFGTTDQEEIAQLILQKGKSLQVSDLERSQMLESTVTQIATWVAHNCVHPATNRPYTVSQIKQALGKNYQVQAHKAMKKQYLDAVKFLKDVIPIERAKMELSLEYPLDKDDDVLSLLDETEYVLVKEHSREGKKTLTIQVDPSLYRELNQIAQEMNGRLEILQQQVVMEQQGDMDLEEDLQQRQKQQQKQSKTETSTSVESYDSDDDEAVALAEKLRAVRLQTTDDIEQEDDNSSNHSGGDEATQQRPVVDEKKAKGSDSESENDDYNESSMSRRRNQRKAQKKKNKKAKRLQQQLLQEEESVHSEEEEEASGRRATIESRNEQVVSGRAEAVSAPATDPNAKKCNTCGGSFVNAAAYRAHFRSDWHRFNQKLKMKGLPHVSEQEFLLCDADAFFGSAED